MKSRAWMRCRPDRPSRPCMRTCVLGMAVCALGMLTPRFLHAGDGRRLKVIVSESVVAPAELKKLQAALPGLELCGATDMKDACARGRDAAGAIGFCSVELLNAAPKLRWVQVRSAGVNDLLSENPELMKRLIQRRITLTNARAIYGPEIADHAMALLLAHTRGIADFVRRGGRKVWKRGPHNPMSEGVRPVELTGQTMLIIGFGGIGSQVARRAAAFGMKIYATDPKKIRKPSYIEKIAPPSELHRLLRKADVIVSCVPLTPKTRHLIGKREFAMMKKGAILINVSRGKVVDTDAMVEALRSKQLGAIGLDVTDPEPLPPDHPLWKFDNVIISPHVAVQSQHAKPRLARLIRENLRRFGKGERLHNVVDKQAGY